MARKKFISKNYQFESNYPTNEGHKFTKICDDMMNSLAWQELSIRQRGLYLELKKKFVMKNGGATTNQDEIYITNKDKSFGSKYSYNTLFKDVDALIEHGFIRVIQHGRLARLPNIYGFSDKWKKFGKTDFFIHPNDRRLTDTKKDTRD